MDPHSVTQRVSRCVDVLGCVQPRTDEPDSPGWSRRLHDHGKVVLVEGVESDGARAVGELRTGVDLASGYRYAPSMTEQEFVEYLDS